MLSQLIYLLPIVHIPHNEPIEERHYDEIPQSVVDQNIFESWGRKFTKLFEFTLQSNVELADPVRLDEN